MISLATPVATGGTEQQYLVSCTVDAIGPLGTFDKFSGGDASSSITMYRPGGMGPEQAFQALPTYSDVTITRAYLEDRDHVLYGRLLPLTGRTTCTVMVQPLDDEGNPHLSPRTYVGRLSAVKDSGTDSESGKVRTWDLMMKVETTSG